MKKPNVIPLVKSVIVRVPYTPTELKYANSVLDTSMMSKGTKEELNRKAMEEQASFFEVVIVSSDVTEVQVGDYIKWRFPSAQFIPEVFVEDGERYFNLPIGFVTSKIEDVKKYLKEREIELQLLNTPKLEMAKA